MRLFYLEEPGIVCLDCGQLLQGGSSPNAPNTITDMWCECDKRMDEEIIVICSTKEKAMQYKEHGLMILGPGELECLRKETEAMKKSNLPEEPEIISLDLGE